MNGKSLDRQKNDSPDVADAGPYIAGAKITDVTIECHYNFKGMSPAEISETMGLNLSYVNAVLARWIKPWDIYKGDAVYEKFLELLKDKKDGSEFVSKTFSGYRSEKEPAPGMNVMIEVDTKENRYKLIRLNNKQYYLLQKKSLAIMDDYSHQMTLSCAVNCIYGSFSKTLVALINIFGESGPFFDEWKGSFSFPFLILKEGDEEFGYVMNVRNCKSTIDYSFQKLIRDGDDRFERTKVYDPFDDFYREEERRFIDFFISCITVSFESIKDNYNKFFFQAVRTNLILFGYKDGVFFDEQYENEKEFYDAIKKLRRKQEEELKSRK